jgi:hypothetical protein
MLQSRRAIVYTLLGHGVFRKYRKMTVCVIMRDMIVKNERDNTIYYQGWKFQRELVSPAPKPVSFQQFFMCTIRFVM